MRVLITQDPFKDPNILPLQRGNWPAKWISHPRIPVDEPAVVAYRRKFSLDRKSNVRIHVTADERYELFLDGKRIGRGSERGDRENWFYETYDLDVSAGDHILVAGTWWLGPDTPAPYAQHSVRPGFLLVAENQPENLMDTGAAEWECKRLGGYTFIPETITWGTGARVHIRGAEFAWGFETGDGDGWEDTKVVGPARNASVANEHPPIWMLRPALLPPMLEETLQVGDARHVQSVSMEDTSQLPVTSSEHLESEAADWNMLLKGGSALTIPSNAMRRVVVDLENYYCAYPELVLSGGKGSKVRVHWAEALYEQSDRRSKGNRDEIEGKYFFGIGDRFEPDGGNSRRFDTLWWECGRYVEVLVSTGDDPLTIEVFRIRETHYPFEYEHRFESADPRLEEVIPIAIRGLEMCSHETYMDCPYYEQLQYVGDTRLEALVTYTITRDDRLPRKALEILDVSRLNSGLTRSRYPSRIMQIIPPFSLWWIGMVHDYAMWRDDPEFVADRMPGVRAILDAFRQWINKNDLVEGPNGWNFVDWVPKWF